MRRGSKESTDVEGFRLNRSLPAPTNRVLLTSSREDTGVSVANVSTVAFVLLSQHLTTIESTSYQIGNINQQQKADELDTVLFSHGEKQIGVGRVRHNALNGRSVASEHLIDLIVQTFYEPKDQRANSVAYQRSSGRSIEIKQTNHFVVASSEQHVAIGREIARSYHVWMQKRLDLCSSDCIPQLCGVIGTCCGCLRCLSVQFGAPHSSTVTSERSHPITVLYL